MNTATNLSDLPRAPWVDGAIRPKKHGVFEGHFQGEKGQIREFFWTGRKWLYKDRRGRWLPSVFGVKGDKWRGLAVDPGEAQPGRIMSESESAAAAGAVTGLQSISKEAAGDTCEDEGCPHYGTPHSHSTTVAGVVAPVTGRTRSAPKPVAAAKKPAYDPLDDDGGDDGIADAVSGVRAAYQASAGE